MSAFDEFEGLIKNVVSRYSSGEIAEISGGAGEIRGTCSLELSIVRPIFEPRISRIQIKSFTF